VETKTLDTQSSALSPQPLIRYQLSNHLGSAALEIDDQAQVITQEEYHPYGTTAYCAGRSAAEVSVKRYRYTGKERDEETGFSYHSARYYAPWLGRWGSCDPIGVGDGLNVYAYCHNTPTFNVDPLGTQTKIKEDSVLHAVDSTLESKRIQYNTETKVKFTLSDGTEVIRRLDRVYKDPNTQEWTFLEAKGHRLSPSNLTSSQLGADALIQEKGARFEILESAGKPRSSLKVEGISFSKGFTGQLKRGNLQYITGNPGYTPGEGQPRMLDVHQWREIIEVKPSAVNTAQNEGMARLTKPNEPTRYISQDEANAIARKNGSELVEPEVKPKTKPLELHTGPGRGAFGGGSVAGAIGALLILNDVIKANGGKDIIGHLNDLVWGGLGLDPEARIRVGETFKVTREDHRAAQRAVVQRELELLYSAYANQHNVSIDEAKRMIRAHSMSGSPYTTIGP
jgi:RHS repeat-associated protein